MPKVSEHPLLRPRTQAFGIVSGENPAFPAQAQGHEAAGDLLRRLNLHAEPIRGRYGAEEQSWLVHNPTLEQMQRLGQHLGQESVIFSPGNDQPHQLVYTNGPKVGSYHPGINHEVFDRAPSDYYSQIPGHEGYLRLNFDWDQLHPVSEPVAKGIYSTLATAALATFAPQFHAQGWKNLEKDPKLNAISQIESSGGKNVIHQPHSKGEYHTAFGALGLKPVTAHEEWKATPNLQRKYPGLEDETKFVRQFKHRPQFYYDVAASHFARLLKRHRSPTAAAYAWRHGSGAAHRATPEQIHGDPYVVRFQGLQTKKSEAGTEPKHPLAYPWPDPDSSQHLPHKSPGAVLRHGPGFAPTLVPEPRAMTWTSTWFGAEAPAPAPHHCHVLVDKDKEVEQLLADHGVAVDLHSRSDYSHKNFDTGHVSVPDASDAAINNYRLLQGLAQLLTRPQRKIVRNGIVGVHVPVADALETISWRDRAQTKYRELLKRLGIEISDSDFNSDRNHILNDTIYRFVTGRVFDDPSWRPSPFHVDLAGPVNEFTKISNSNLGNSQDKENTNMAEISKSEARNILAQALRRRLDAHTQALSELRARELKKAETETRGKVEVLEKKTPPGVGEELMHKLKREYKGDKAKAYATAWKIHNKEKTDKNIDVGNAPALGQNAMPEPGMAPGTLKAEPKQVVDAPKPFKPETETAPDKVKAKDLTPDKDGAKVKAGPKPMAKAALDPVRARLQHARDHASRASAEAAQAKQIATAPVKPKPMPTPEEHARRAAAYAEWMPQSPLGKAMKKMHVEPLMKEPNPTAKAADTWEGEVEPKPVLPRTKTGAPVPAPKKPAPSLADVKAAKDRMKAGGSGTIKAGMEPSAPAMAPKAPKPPAPKMSAPKAPAMPKEPLAAAQTK